MIFYNNNMFSTLFNFFTITFIKLKFFLQSKSKYNIYNFNILEFKKYIFRFLKINFYSVDILFSKIMSLKYYNNTLVVYRSFFRINNYKLSYVNFFKLYKSNYYSGLKSLWLALRYWVFPLFFFSLVIYYSVLIKLLPFNKIMLAWISIFMFFYWLISGFVFFIKKYQFGKYTSVVQRFWRRAYILFWMIEGGTFFVFLFLTFNSSQESFYMFDQISIFKTHLYSWKIFLYKIFPPILLLLVTYIFIILLKSNIFNKFVIFISFITCLLTYSLWLEFYQFFHVLNFYGNLNWIYDVDDHNWVLELEPRRTRIVNHYVMLLFILKFWHIVFIYGFWIFSVLRFLEIKRIRYPLLSANFQNFLILYMFSWVYMYPWLKFYFRKFLDAPYYWFYVNNRIIFFKSLLYDLKIYLYSLNNFLKFNKSFTNYDFYYFNKSGFDNNFEIFRKHVILNKILNYLQK